MSGDRDTTQHYRIDEAIAFAEVEGEILILTPDEDVLYTVNGTGLFIWNLLADGATLGEMIKRLAAEYSIALEQAERDVTGFLRQLEEKNII